MLALRKEVKMGAAIGLTVLGIAGVYGLMASLSAGDHSQSASADPKGLDGAIGGLPPRDTGETISPPPVAPPPVAKPAVDPFLESVRTDGNKHNDNILNALSTGRMGGDVKSTSNAGGPLVTPAPKPAAMQNPLITPASDNKTTQDDAPPVVSPKPAGEKSTPVDALAGKYVVQSGDTFSTISAKLYGTKKYYAALAKANPDVNPSRLRIGHQINVPAKESLATARGSIETDPTTLTKPIDATRQYRVASGDTLSRIATKLYGKSTMWEEIYETNKSTIGPDSGRLKLGMVLELPKKPATATIAR